MVEIILLLGFLAGAAAGGIAYRPLKAYELRKGNHRDADCPPK